MGLAELLALVGHQAPEALAAPAGQVVPAGLVARQELPGLRESTGLPAHLALVVQSALAELLVHPAQVGLAGHQAPVV